MDWYYAVGGDRKGPLTEVELQRLAVQGVVTPQTLVWHEGMADWQPYAQFSTMPRTGAAGSGGEICASCGNVFPTGELISLEGRPYCAACKPLIVQRLREGESASPAADAMRNEHLKHEASIRSVGFLYYIGGAVFLLVAAGSLLAARSNPGTVPFAGVSWLLLLMGAGQIWVGTGLRRLQRWARIPTGILSGLGLLGFPLGTLINGYILYLVFSRKGRTIFSDEYHEVIAQTPHIRYRTSIVVWIILGIILLLIAFAVIATFVGRSR